MLVPEAEQDSRECSCGTTARPGSAPTARSRLWRRAGAGAPGAASPAWGAPRASRMAIEPHGVFHRQSDLVCEFALVRAHRGQRVGISPDTCAQAGARERIHRQVKPRVGRRPRARRGVSLGRLTATDRDSVARPRPRDGGVWAAASSAVAPSDGERPRFIASNRASSPPMTHGRLSFALCAKWGDGTYRIYSR
jgi:hypothetical protein